MVDEQHSDKITPARVELTRPPESAGGHRRGTRWLWLPALVLIVLAGGALWYWLPGQVALPASSSPPPTAAEPRPLDESPYREAQLAQARRDAQQVLSRVLEKQQFLENRKVQAWAEKPFQAALDLAAEGDELYRQRRFEQALARYRRAEQRLGDLQDLAGQVLEESLAAGGAALAEGDARAAAEAFRRALLIDAKHEEAAAGLRRAQSLPEVQSLLARGDEARSGGKLEQARGHYAAALDRDPAHEAAAERLNDVERAIRDRDFNAAMGRGFKAFENSDANAAVAAFEQALELKPEHDSAASALRQARRLETRLRLDKLLARARSLEDEEARGGDALSSSPIHRRQPDRGWAPCEPVPGRSWMPVSSGPCPTRCDWGIRRCARKRNSCWPMPGNCPTRVPGSAARSGNWSRHWPLPGSR